MNITDLAVNDDVVDMITCPQTTLDVGDTITCRGTYTVTQQDAARGSVTNTARATGMADANEVTSPEASVTIRVTDDGDGRLKLVKKVDNSHPYQPGDTVTYRYLVTNNSSGTVNDVRIEDSRVPGVTCRPTTLAPGASATCTGTYTVPERSAGKAKCKGGSCYFSITNTVVASAEDLTSAPDTVTIKVVQKPHHCRPGKKSSTTPGCPAKARDRGVVR
ncbi:hypothetical protein ACIBP6_03300 [Nonomuraea terrae]|uniref:DUF7507 domain-containing protein n=1 Tax=Nonomuraea terrae TaxID=2530383 RepID=UPI0037A9BD04